MKKDILKQIIRDWHTAPLPALYRRKLSVPLGAGKIITLIGSRRSGKTSYLYNIAAILADQGVERTDALYINFEDERLNLSVEDLDLVMQAYRELYPNLDLARCTLLFDEIQQIGGWDKFVRRVYDTMTKNIVLTGSSARLLGEEIAATLRGRTVSYTVFPFSFQEYLEFKDIQVDLYKSKSVALIHHQLHAYLRNGGFPEVIHYEESLRSRVLQEYFNVMIYRDLAERHEIKNLTALKFFLKRVLACATKQISVHNIYNELKSAGYKIGKNQLYDYMDACRDIHLVFTLAKYTTSLVERELGEKKVYAVDNGLLNAVQYRFSDDIGKAMEQTVFLELLRREKQISFFKTRFECDFLVREERAAYQAIQVTLTLADDKTRKREIRGLLECCKAVGLKEGMIVTYDETDEITIDNIRITVVPLFRWLLT
jgi:predicted AAA+ superfamily ATPase